ncbi:MAG: PTS ascorbate transporter subunit IIB [Clostridiales bacterium]|nr:PTS ascorbate transporter subunit IIB [Clostridiales bacterium]
MSGLRVLVCCPNGAGVSLMMESVLRKVADRSGLELAQLCHSSIQQGEKTAGEYDLVLCPAELAPRLKDWESRVDIIGLKNPLSRREMQERLTAYCQSKAQERDRQ